MRDRRFIYAFVVLAYLFYTIYEADWTIRRGGDLYSILGVPIDANDRTINSKFRRLTVTYHPDKVPGNVDRHLAEAVYIRMQQSRNILVDPIKRFAYDRFGPSIMEWRTCKTAHDYVWHGLYETALYYFGTTAVLGTLAAIGYLRYATFVSSVFCIPVCTLTCYQWRFTAIAAMFALEVHLTTQPETLMILSNVINPILTKFTNHPPYLQWQILSLLRNILISFFIALNQIGPKLFPPPPSDKGATTEQLSRLEQVTTASEQEALRLFNLEMTPFADNSASLQDLKVAMRRWLIDNTVKSDPQVRDAMGRVLQPRAGAHSS